MHLRESDKKLERSKRVKQINTTMFLRTPHTLLSIYSATNGTILIQEKKLLIQLLGFILEERYSQQSAESITFTEIET